MWACECVFIMFSRRGNIRSMCVSSRCPCKNESRALVWRKGSLRVSVLLAYNNGPCQIKRTFAPGLSGAALSTPRHQAEGGHISISQGKRRTLIIKVGVGGRAPSNPLIFTVHYLTASTDSVTTLQPINSILVYCFPLISDMICGLFQFT